MSIEVSCDDCGRDFRVNDASAGKKVRCKCGASVRVPDDDYEDEAPVRRSSSRRGGKGAKNNDTVMTVLIGGGAGFLGLLVLGLIFLRGDSSSNLPPPPPSTSNVASTAPAAVPPTGTSSAPLNTSPVPSAPTTPTVPTTPTKPTTPAAPVKPVGNTAASAPVANARKQSIETVFQLGHSGKDAAIMIAPNGRFIVLDQVVHDVTTGEKLWKVPLSSPEKTEKGKGRRREKETLYSLSLDGTVFAEGSENGQKLTLYYKEDKDGFNTFELAVPKNASKLLFLRFTVNQQLVAAFKVNNTTRVGVMSAEKPKKAVKDFQTDEFSQETGAISDDGKFLAVGAHASLKVYDLVKGVSVAMMEAGASSGLPFLGLTGVAFSPDNSELAAVIGSTIRIWSNRGKLIEEYGGVVNSDPFYNFNGIAYLPDKSALMMNGTDLFDRASKIMVWQLKRADSYKNHPWSVLDSEHIVVSGGEQTHGQLAVIKIPREDVAKASQAIVDKAEAVLAPGVPISIEYEVGEPRFSSRQEVTNQIHKELTARLSKFGIPVEDNQPVTMKVVYTEAPGETVEYVEHTGPGPPIPKPFRSQFDPPGVKVVSTNHNLSAVLMRKDDTRVWWKERIVQGSPGSLKGAANESNVRNESFEAVKHKIADIDVPRFLPVDTNIPGLPLKSDLGSL